MVYSSGGNSDNDGDVSGSGVGGDDW